MSDTFAAVLRVEWGGLSFPAETVTLRDVATRNQAGSLAQYERVVRVHGKIWGANSNEVVERTRAMFLATFNGPRTLRVIAMNDTLAIWLEPATIASEGGSGPFVGQVTFGDVTPGYCEYDIDFVATWRYPGGAAMPPARQEEEERIEERVGEDGRSFVRRSGRIQGLNASAALGGKLPAPNPQQTYTYNSERNHNDTECRYQIDIRPLHRALPVACDEGEAMVEVVRDGLGQTTRVSGHYVGPGALSAASQAARDYGPGARRGAIVERIVRTIHSQQRVDFAQEFIERDGSLSAVGWNERVRVSSPTPRVVAREYPGIGPLLLSQPDVATHVEHSGTVVHLDNFGQIPPPILEADYPVADREIEREWVDPQRRRTSWRYLHVLTDAAPTLEPGGPR